MMSDQIAPTMRGSVFISYAKQDEAVADFVQNALNRAGYRASSFTTGIPAGSRWLPAIQISLETADVVVILLSRLALDSPWVLYEIAASIASVERSLDKRVIPVALSTDLAPTGVLAQYQWIFTSGEPNEVADAVMKALRQPQQLDRVSERAFAHDGLERVSEILDVETEALELRRLNQAQRVMLIFASGMTISIVAFFTFLLAANHGEAWLSAAVAALATLVGGMFGFIIGLRSKRGAI